MWNFHYSHRSIFVLCISCDDRKALKIHHYLFSYVFMCEELIISERRVHPQQSYEPPASCPRYTVSSAGDITKLRKLLYRTSRVKATDTYLWISPFVR